jgi:hypothetical protein
MPAKAKRRRGNESEAEIKEDKHEKVSGKRDLEAIKAYIVAFDNKAKELASKYDDAEKIAAELKKSLPERRESAFLIGANVEMKYLKK